MDALTSKRHSKSLSFLDICFLCFNHGKELDSEQTAVPTLPSNKSDRRVRRRSPFHENNESDGVISSSHKKENVLLSVRKNDRPILNFD